MKGRVSLFSAIFIACTLTPQTGVAEVSCKLAQNAFSIASKLRGLPKKRDVQCELHNRDQVEDYLKNELQKKAPQQKIRAEAAIFNLLGLILFPFFGSFCFSLAVSLLCVSIFSSSMEMGLKIVRSFNYK